MDCSWLRDKEKRATLDCLWVADKEVVADQEVVIA